METQSFLQGLQLVDIYARNYGFGNASVVSDCPGTLGALSGIHQTVLEQVALVRAGLTASSALVSQLNCAAQPVLRDAQFLNQASSELVVLGLETDLANFFLIDEVRRLLARTDRPSGIFSPGNETSRWIK